jgi:hypothetical protein
VFDFNIIIKDYKMSQNFHTLVIFHQLNKRYWLYLLSCLVFGLDGHLIASQQYAIQISPVKLISENKTIRNFWVYARGIQILYIKMSDLFNIL